MSMGIGNGKSGSALAVGTVALLWAGGMVAVPLAANANVVVNGGFESGSGNTPSDWFIGGGGSRSNLAAASGSYSGEYTATAGNSNGMLALRSYGVNLLNNSAAAIPGNRITISWDWEFSNITEPTDTTNTQGLGIWVRFFNATPVNNSESGTFLGQFFFGTGDGTSVGYGLGSQAHFIAETATYSAPVGAESMDVIFGPVVTGVSGTAFVDNISVSAVPEPSALGLLAVGEIGLLLAKRRNMMSRTQTINPWDS
ncbi:MAG: PEP-CTERM sorting domain-containing protein [Planctomycetia bacterium]|nr:PEP-CTERM sorting domain-containing protein [Planctomycetia bacterium]